MLLEAISAGCKLNATRIWLGGVSGSLFDHGMAAQNVTWARPFQEFVRFVCWTRQALFLVCMKI